MNKRTELVKEIMKVAEHYKNGELYDTGAMTDIGILLDDYEKSHRFLSQPSEIEKLMKDKLEYRKIYDEFGWTGEWRLSAKDVLDIIIDFRNC